MSEYRDELDAAHHRIAQLESDASVQEVERARQRLRTQTTRAWLTFFAGGVVGVSALCLLRHKIDALFSAPPPVVTIALPVTAPLPPPEILVPEAQRAPTLVDVNDHGSVDMVGVFTGADGLQRVVAIDGTRLTTIWTLGPFHPRPAGPHSGPLGYVVAGDRVAIENGGNVYVYDLASGAYQSMIASPDTGEICLASKAGIQRGKKGSDGSIAVGQLDASPTEILINGTVEQPNSAMILDLASGARRDPPNEAWCYAPEVGSAGRGCVRKEDDDCSEYRSPPFPTPKFSAFRTYREKGLRVSEGNDGAGFALGFRAGAKSATWSHSLLADGDTELDGYMSSAIGDGRFYSAYETKDRHELRMVAHAIDTGEVIWTQTLARDADPYPVAITAKDDRILVVTRAQTLHVVDARTGADLRRFPSE